MPELPEVQTVLDTLELRIKNRQIVDIKVLYEPIIVGSVSNFKKKMIGQHFRSFKRRGKYLIFEMDDIAFISHLRMEGKYFLQSKDDEINKHTHVIFYLDNGVELRYNDVRKFGRMELMEIPEDNYLKFKELGPEPFSKDFNVKYIKDYLKNNKKTIKEVLLDQSFVAGVGNIYADEICFHTGILPSTISSKLSEEDMKKMISSTRKILSKAIEAGGTTIRSYTSSLGVSGRFQLKLAVHTQSECKKCGSEIIKSRIGGRGTYHCPNCQKDR